MYCLDFNRVKYKSRKAISFLGQEELVTDLMMKYIHLLEKHTGLADYDLHLDFSTFSLDSSEFRRLRRDK